MDARYQIPEGLDREALMEIHSELLSTHYSVRVNFRWGDYTEYSVRIKWQEAAALTKLQTDPDVTWRLAVGLSEPDEDGRRDVTVDVQYHDQTTKEWETVCYDGTRDVMLVSAVDLMDATATFIQAKHPVLAALLDIDSRLL